MQIGKKVSNHGDQPNVNNHEDWNKGQTIMKVGKRRQSQRLKISSSTVKVGKRTIILKNVKKFIIAGVRNKCNNPEDWEKEDNHVGWEKSIINHIG